METLENLHLIARLLRDAAAQAISEDLFWQQFKVLIGDTPDSRVAAGYDEVVHYWGNFHERNLFLVPVKPDRGQLENGKAALNLIADALEGDWAVEELKKRLKADV